MKVSIGVFARNEEKLIGQFLEGLFSQTLFQENTDVEVFCLANGCSDRTVEIAKQTPCKIIEISEGNKIATWNLFTHHKETQHSDYLIFMDADIILEQKDLLEQLINYAIKHPETVITTDLPKKIFQNLLLSPISMVFSKITAQSQAVMSGQLYCGKGEFFRSLSMPIRGFLADDAFIKEMAVSNKMKGSRNLDSVKRVPDTSHLFYTEKSLSDYFHHEVRERIARTTLIILLDYLSINPDKQPGTLIAENNKRDPSWFITLVNKRCLNRFWVLFPGALFSAFHRLKNLPWPKQLLYSPLVFTKALVDIPIALVANQKIRKGLLQETWKDKR